jgi:ribonuclease-3
MAPPPSQLECATARSGEGVEAALTELEAVLGYPFARSELLVHALTHRSLANERAAAPGSLSAAAQQDSSLADSSLAQSDHLPNETGDNERLEFLGDAVLGLAVAEALFAAHPEWQEGELTRVRAQLVSRKHVAEVAQAIGLGRHLRLSRGEDRSGLRSKTTVLSNTMEAVMGALFLDGGLQPVRVFVRNHVLGVAVEQLAEELRSGAALGNFKSALQEFLQSARAGTPIYIVKGESGPDHRKRFLVEARLKPMEGSATQPLARGKGSTKKLAEQDAARRAMELLNSGAVRIGAAGIVVGGAEVFDGLSGEESATE